MGNLIGRCYIHIIISVDFTIVEIRGGMVEEEVDEVHNSLTQGNNKVEVAKGIMAEGGA